jgi:hypothetical protein
MNKYNIGTLLSNRNQTLFLIYEYDEYDDEYEVYCVTAMRHYTYDREWFEYAMADPKNEWEVIA